MQTPVTIPLSPVQARYGIVEAFSTWQGEGVHAGRAAHFIRLYGCDQRCHFCDSAGTWHPSWKPDGVELLDAQGTADLVNAQPGAFVVLTGGEPALYNLAPLVDELKQRGRTIHIETAGHKPLPAGLDWVTLSPKLFAKPPLVESWARANEIKLICESREQIARDLETILKASRRATAPIWLHPEWSQRHNRDVLDAITDHVKAYPSFNVRAGYQIHKLFAADNLDPNASRVAVPLGGIPGEGRSSI